jgi:hypothetical protein
MSLPLQYSDYNNEAPKNIRKNKTYKKRPTKKVQNFLQSMDNNNMADFKSTAPQYPAHPQKSLPLTKKTDTTDQTDSSIESFGQLPDTTNAEEYYRQYVPYYTNVENSSQISGNNKNMLLEKLNYMIHLLEEQQEDKTGNVAEELILYLFLGIFVIFVVDSFARAAKYTR